MENMVMHFEEYGHNAIIISGINRAETPADVTAKGLLIMKGAMLIFPLISIVAGYLVYRAKYKIDKKFYDKIVSDLEERGDLKVDGSKTDKSTENVGYTCWEDSHVK